MKQKNTYEPLKILITKFSEQSVLTMSTENDANWIWEGFYE